MSSHSPGDMFLFQTRTSAVLSSDHPGERAEPCREAAPEPLSNGMQESSLMDADVKGLVKVKQESPAQMPSAKQNPEKEMKSNKEDSSENNSKDGLENDGKKTSKYKTVSYRKIRRGNTRQRVDEFEAMVNS